MKVQTVMVQSSPVSRQTESETDSYRQTFVIKEVAEEITIHARLSLFWIGQKDFIVHKMFGKGQYKCLGTLLIYQCYTHCNHRCRRNHYYINAGRVAGMMGMRKRSPRAFNFGVVSFDVSLTRRHHLSRTFHFIAGIRQLAEIPVWSTGLVTVTLPPPPYS